MILKTKNGTFNIECSMELPLREGIYLYICKKNADRKDMLKAIEILKCKTQADALSKLKRIRHAFEKKQEILII